MPEPDCQLKLTVTHLNGILSGRKEYIFNPSTFPSRCSCGSSLCWESSSDLQGFTRFVAVCASHGCGQIHTPLDAPQELQSFLLPGQRTRPPVSPWLRSFLSASRIPRTAGWRPTGDPCWSCAEDDLTVSFCFRPSNTPQTVELCIRCGALTATHLYGGTLNRVSGEDWTNLTGAIGDFRRAIRQRQTRADNGQDEAMDGLWDD